MFSWLALLALCFMVIGVLALFGYGNAEVGFWSKSAIKSDAGKIIWVVVSTICLVVFMELAASEHRRKSVGDPPSKSIDQTTTKLADSGE